MGWLYNQVYVKSNIGENMILFLRMMSFAEYKKEQTINLCMSLVYVIKLS